MPVARRLPGSLVFLALLACIFLTASLRAVEPAADPAQDPGVREALAILDLWIAEQASYHEIPGLAIGIVQGNRLIWAKGYGKANLETGERMTPATPFRIGSVSKLFTATAILQLRDAGKLRLDDPVLRHLPFSAAWRNQGGCRLAGGVQAEIRLLLDQPADLRRAPLRRQQIMLAGDTWARGVE